ncbi:MAG: ribonuclease P protein component [Burkholderiales bacterium]|nr:ribonuclease P protein component [Burkholderiales bacterium]MBH2016188.1 ribonuclease P protein component [Burkholderiales bacterium]
MARTAHFSLHILPRVVVAPPVPGGARVGREAAVCAAAPADLSTGEPGEAHLHVDDLAPAWRLGLVLPKKQARRSVTRSLMRHQAREAFRRHAPGVRAIGRHGAEVDGWVVRLRAPFDRKLFPSAASDALHAAVRLELDELWARLSGAQA